MNIAVLGTGMVGVAHATKLAELGHQVMMGSRSADNLKAAEWVKSAVAGASQGTFAEAARFGEIIFNCTLGMATLDALNQVQAAKDQGIVVFTVGLSLGALETQFPGTGVFTEDMLLTMATDQSKFFSVIEPSILDDAFQQVSEQLTQVAGTDVRIIEVLPDHLTYVTGSAVPAPSEAMYA